MKSLAGKPEDDGTPPNTAQRGQGEARQFSPGRSLLLPEGPVLIQEKAVDRAPPAVASALYARSMSELVVGKSHSRPFKISRCTQGVQPTDQTKPQHLPRQAAPLKNVMRVLFDVTRSNEVGDVVYLSLVKFRCFYTIKGQKLRIGRSEIQASATC